MSKIVCDVCGASYDDTQGACPLCGWNPNEPLADGNADDFDMSILDDAVGAEQGARKAKAAFDYDAAESAVRAGGPGRVPQKQDDEDDSEEEEEDDDEEEEEGSGSNVFLIIVLILLILALIGVSAYLIYTRILKPGEIGDEGNRPTETTSAIAGDTGSRNTEATAAATLPAATVATEVGVPCTDLTLVGTMDKLTFAGQYWRLMVKAAPENTTDKITYTSGNEKVVTIDEYGRVTAVGEGTTTITVTCGDKRLETTAVVDFGTTTATTAPTATTPAAGTTGNGTAATTTNNGSLKIVYHGTVRSDFTLSKKGIYIELELQGCSVTDAKWTTTNGGVASVNNGKVTAIGKGTCVIRAEYNGQVVEATIRCKW